MQVKALMNKQVVFTSPDTSLPKVWDLIFKKHIHGLPIVNAKKQLVGIISEEDLLTKLFPDYEDIIPDFSAGEDFDDEIKLKLEKLRHWTAEKIMNTTVFYTRTDSNVMRALSRMIIRKVRQLPVLDDNNQLIGMISKGDIFDRLFKGKIKKLFRSASIKAKS